MILKTLALFAISFLLLSPLMVSAKEKTIHIKYSDGIERLLPRIVNEEQKFMNSYCKEGIRENKCFSKYPILNHMKTFEIETFLSTLIKSGFEYRNKADIKDNVRVLIKYIRLPVHPVRVIKYGNGNEYEGTGKQTAKISYEIQVLNDEGEVVRSKESSVGIMHINSRDYQKYGFKYQFNGRQFTKSIAPLLAVLANKTVAFVSEE